MAPKKNRRSKPRFTSIPHRVMESPNYAFLDGWDVKLLLELAKQYNGYNNGDLSAPFSIMKNIGWRSSGTLNKATQNLIHYGFIQKARQGGKNKCNLFALTWEPINECKGKLDIEATSRAADSWKQPTAEINSCTRYMN